MAVRQVISKEAWIVTEPKEYLLARSDPPEIPSSPGFQDRESSLPGQSHVVQFEYSSKSFYEAMFSNHQGTQIKMYKEFCIS